MPRRYAPKPDPPVWTTQTNSSYNKTTQPLIFEGLTHFQVKDLVNGVLNLMFNVPEKDATVEIYCEGVLRARVEVYPKLVTRPLQLDEGA